MPTVEQQIPRIPLGDEGEPCQSCGAPLAADQRYCLNCGARRAEPRVDYERHLAANGRGGEAPPRRAGILGGGDRDTTPLLVLGALFALAVMFGLGVLIGDNSGGGGGQTAAGPSVIHVQSSGAGGTGGGPAKNVSNTSGGAFKSDWPSGKAGYTVEIGALDKASATPADVASAKQQATSNGASSVGALDSDQYASLPSGKYVIYSGVYDTKAQATKALKPLKSKFPDATVIKVSTSSGGGGGGGAAAGGSSSLSSGSSSQPVSSNSQAVQSLQNSSGQSYENQVKNIKKPISTGSGKPPPKDNKPAGAGGSATVIK